MRHYKQGISREQGMMLPKRVDENVAEDSEVRVIDIYVESLDLEKLGFRNTRGGLTAGQPAYAPQGLLKLYLYGFLQGIRSSRKLERECGRNLEVIWLLEGLKPSYKTIANFRKDNVEGIKAVNRDFVEMCKELELFGKELAAIDGSYFRGNVGKKSIYTEKRLKKTLKRLEQYIKDYLAEIERLDAEESDMEDQDIDWGEKKLAYRETVEKLKERQQKHRERLKKLQASGEKQLAEVDEDARLLTKNGETVAGYNVQAVVDSKHKLIATYEVTQDGNDTRQLAPMAKKVQQVLEVDELDVAADKGYYNFGQIKECVDVKIIPYVPEPDKDAQAKSQKRFVRSEFQYQAENDCYVCPAGEMMPRYSQCVQNDLLRWAYRSQPSVCADCPLKKRCLPAKHGFRSIYRWEHEEVIEVHRQRMADKGRSMMRLRACLAEHPFGTLKRWCGWDHFLLRGLPKVDAEMALYTLGYNFKRVLNILGTDKFRAFCLRRREIAASIC
jgi:transposase